MVPFSLASTPFKLPIPHSSLFLNSVLISYTLTALIHSPPSTLAATAFNGSDTDRLALLAIKAQITFDPLSITASWNDSLHFCNWSGVICGQRHHRVVTLNLSHHGLVGSLSPHIGNLTFLRGINLEQNNFHGQIPPQVGRLFRLKYLNLSNNSFSGEIPANLSGCSSLVMLRLGFNRLIGKIPFQIGSLQKLERVQFHYNNLSGTIPDSLGNLSSVRSLSMSVNSLEGRLPDSLGRLKTLNFVGFGLNRLSGTIPLSVYNLSSITTLTLPYNQLSGNLPADLGYTLPNLQILNIGHNLFTGPLPLSLSNASNLIEFDTNGSNFSGKVSIDFGGLPGLWWLVLASTQLGTGQSDDLDFLNSLTKCRNLQILDLSNCQFGGKLPNSIANLSDQLRQLRLGGNRLSGNIPTGIANLANLTELTMEKNNLSGYIPGVIGGLGMLRRLDLSENELSGQIPSSIANITQLYELHLQKNQLTGKIPSSFGNLSYLQDLDLSQNFLSGTIPESVMGLSSLTISLNLARNQLSGSLVLEAGDLKNLGYLDVSDNKLSGEIPGGLGSCLTLERLHMAGNLFEGSIPASFSSLRGLRELDLSLNNLSGQIPEFLQLLSLVSLNLSLNNFEGKVPEKGVFNNVSAISLAGNSKLCGGVPELKLPPCTISESRKAKLSGGLKLVIGLLSGILGLVLIISLLTIYRERKTKRRSLTPSSSSKELFMQVTYGSLHKATDGFSSANLIGSGSFGSVYKGVLDPNKGVVAVKVLYLHQRGALKSFVAECEALRNIRHRNLVKILTACSSVDLKGNEFKALVYEYMPNGSLENWLHPTPDPDDINGDLRALGLLQRLNIAIDVASVLEYLHHHHQNPIVHCDLKPSNILLDADMTARVGDFGLVKFILETPNRSSSNQSSSVGLKGTIGYVPPEYGMGSKVSIYGDVYSYGILLLEIFTGKRPNDEMFKDGFDLHNLVRMALPERVSDILDPLFVTQWEGEEAEISKGYNYSSINIRKDQLEECLIAILKIGVACSVENPRERMDIMSVVKELTQVRARIVRSNLC